MRKTVVIRGGGDIASGIALRLFNSGFYVIILETNKPTVIRRTVAFASALYEGEIEIEKVKGIKVENINDAINMSKNGYIPVIIDPEGESINKINPDALVDSILAKTNLGTKIDMAPIVIGIGPGFSAGEDVDAVIETKRGHYLGRVILKGKAHPNTGIPGSIEGFSEQRVLRAPIEGVIEINVVIGDMVDEGSIIAYVDKKPVIAQIKGVVRGLLKNGLKVHKGMKIGDIDPRGNKEYCFSVSDKARSIGGGVLESILHFYYKNK